MIGSIKNIYIILNSEIKRFIYRPYLYIGMALFYFITGVIVVLIIPQLSGFNKNASVQDIYNAFFIFILFLVPLLPLHSFSEENNSNIYELIFSSPVSYLEFVLGKFLALISIYKTIMFFTLIYALSIQFFADSMLNWGAIILAVMGNMLIGIYILSIGFFFSSLTSNTMLSLTTTYFVTISSFILNQVVSKFLGPYWKAGEEFVVEMLPFKHFNNFMNGVFDVSDFLYFLFVPFLMAFLSAKLLEIKYLRK